MDQFLNGKTRGIFEQERSLKYLYVYLHVIHHMMFELKEFLKQLTIFLRTLICRLELTLIILLFQLIILIDISKSPVKFVRFLRKDVN